MPQDIPIGYGQATFGFTHENSPRALAITLGVALPDPGTPAIDVANSLYQRFAQTVLEDLDNGLTFEEVKLFIGNGSGPSGSVSSQYSPLTGGRSMVSMPLNTAVLVTKSTGFLGRRGRGRMSVPSSGPASDVSEVGNLSDSLRDSLQGSWTDFYDQLQGDTQPGNVLPNVPLAPVLLHSSAPFTPTPINGFVVERKIATRPTRIR